MANTARDLIKCRISNDPGTTGDFELDTAFTNSLLPEATDDGLQMKLNITENGVGTEIRRNCTYTHSTTTFGRGTMVRSTAAADAALNFTSAAIVSVVPSAEDYLTTEVVGASLLPRYRAALAATAANTADTIIAYMGDSTVAGAYGSGDDWNTCRTYCPPVLLGTWLKTRMGLPVSLDAAFGQGASSVELLYDPRVTRTTWTGANDGTPAGLGGGAYRNDTNEAASINFAFVDTFDTIEVDYLTNSGGADFTISVDGGSAIGATVSSTGTLAVATASRTCASGTHTVNINRLAGAGFICIFAVRVRHSTTKRVLCWNWGVGGSAVAAWTDTTYPWTPGNYAPTLAPHLILVQLGINDAIASRTNAEALTDYQALVDMYRVTSDIVFVTPVPVAAASATLVDQRDIVTACREIALRNGCPIVDAAALFGTYLSAATAGYFEPADDAVHPGPTGYQAIADAVSRLPGLLR